MKIISAQPAVFLLLIAALSWACTGKIHGKAQPSPSTTPIASPTPRPVPLIAYLYEGNLWTVGADGAGARQMALSPDGMVIEDFVWSRDGSRIFFSIGLQLFELVIETGNVASAGVLAVPAGTVIDRLDISSDGKTVISQLLNANAVPRNFGLDLADESTRELGIDELNSMVPTRTPIVRNIGEMSVSPDSCRILFKDLVGTGEELFVSNIETGARIQITNLYNIDGFEESIATEGGRRVIEASWSPDGRYVIFNPMQSCSELGICYGRLYLVDVSGGAQFKLSSEMMIGVPREWSGDGKSLAYEDGGHIMVSNTDGVVRQLPDGSRPKWQPK